jgi:RNA 3'-terminal phosphate cyclase (ATP)
VTGAEVGSREFSFIPGEIKAGDYLFDIGTAGSTTLVLQTVLPPLMIQPSPSRLTLVGGTHNAFAPPLDFLQKSFLPLVSRTGPRVTAEMERYGFYPAGGGRFNVEIDPAREYSRLDIKERGEIRSQTARALVVNLPAHIAERELAVVSQKLGLKGEQLRIEASTNAYSAGNAVMIEIESNHLIEVVTRLGERGVRAETVAELAAGEAFDYLESGVPVGEHLADQLLIPLALAGGGSFVTMQPSLHTTTNIEVIRMFLDIPIKTTPLADNAWRIDVGEGQS